MRRQISLPLRGRAGRGWFGGFTILEAAIGLLVLALVAGALGSTFLVGYTIISREAKQVSADAALSQASLSLLRDLSSATSTSYSGPLSPGTGSLSVTFGSAPASTVTYTIDAQSNLIRSSGSTASVAARGLQGLALSSSGCQLTLTLTPRAIAIAQTLQATQRVGAAGCY